MTDFSFSLLTGDTGPLAKGARPDSLRVPLEGHRPVLAEGDQVLAGTLLAKARDDRGDMHAPLAGIIREVSRFAMLIEVMEERRVDPQTAPMEGGDILRRWLRSMGIDVRPLRRAPVLIVNAVPPEPGISIHDPLLRDYRKTVELGLETARRVVEYARLYLMAARGNRANAFADCTVVHVPPVYPNGLPPLVAKAVTGREHLPGQHPENAAILSVSDLYFIGRVMETGRPLTQTVMTIAGQNHLVHVGTPVDFLVAEARGTVEDGDHVILGGLMRGIPALNTDQGVAKDTTGLHILRKSAAFVPVDAPCLGCGECERRCPARIMPGMISRCSEFKQFARAELFHIHSCMECGICGYWCKAKRPLLQYIRLAKYELALLRSAITPAERPPLDPTKEALRENSDA
ncbi:electron transporter RnfC [Pseudodesulfovibrio alkaliphilus]|uniref:electron transporter RnfC n=1 Tax=Pseudodesulfovibrio alkaliphilus TaxID=2661613 RepID=UPI0018C89C75|nr:electron transporter RnfC [Pseudodesulfovibrio alkaliphilus]